MLFLGDYDLTRFGPWYGDVYSSIEDTIISISRLKKIPAGVMACRARNRRFRKPPGAALGRM